MTREGFFPGREEARNSTGRTTGKKDSAAVIY